MAAAREGMTRTEIQQQAMALPEAERVQLADALLESVAPFSLDAAERAKADRALEAYRANPGNIRAPDDVHRRVAAHRVAGE